MSAAEKAKWLPSVEMAEQRYPHGTRARYCFGKCRCELCRDAQRVYNVALSQRRAALPYRLRHIAPTREWRIYRKADSRVIMSTTDKAAALRKLDLLNAGAPRDPRELVSALPAREHLASLQDQGVGLKTAAKMASIAYNVLREIACGEIARTRRATLAKILSVKPQAIAGGARVRSDATLVLIDRLVEAGYRRAWIAFELGAKYPALQIARSAWVSVRKARAVRDLYVRLSAEDPRLPKLGAFEHQLDVPEPTHTRAGRRRHSVPKKVIMRHGTRSKFESGCRCRPCAAANAEYERAASASRQTRFSLVNRRGVWCVLDRKQGTVVFSGTERSAVADVAEAFNMRDPIAGPNTLVDAAPAREHVRTLFAAGLAVRDIAEAAGVSLYTVWSLRNSARARLRNRSAIAIRSVEPNEQRPSTARVDAAATWMLLDRLDAAGFHSDWVADLLNIGRDRVKKRAATIRLEEARAIRALYAEVRDRVATVRTLEVQG